MKKFFKFMLFILIFFLIYMGLSYIFLPKQNLIKYGLYKTSSYTILGEEPNTIDTIVVGDSLVYSSISPMEIYKKYGYTVYDCADAGIIIEDAYNYFEIAADSQKPKVAILEPNFFFRNPKKRPWYEKPKKVLQNSLPLFKYHNNWKKMVFNNKSHSWINYYKGYKKNKNIKANQNYDYMHKNKLSAKIPPGNMEYFKKFVSYCKKNNIKLILISVPSQKSWSYDKHKTVEKLAKQYDLTYVNLNLVEDLTIDWSRETKDKGDHLNFYGAQKVSNYVGKYLEDSNLVKNHKGEKGYEDWDKALDYYLKSK